MKNHPSVSRYRKSQQQTQTKVNPPSKKATKRAKPNRKFGDDLTNLIARDPKFVSRDVSSPSLHHSLVDY